MTFHPASRAAMTVTRHTGGLLPHLLTRSAVVTTRGGYFLPRCSYPHGYLSFDSAVPFVARTFLPGAKPERQSGLLGANLIRNKEISIRSVRNSIVFQGFAILFNHYFVQVYSSIKRSGTAIPKARNHHPYLYRLRVLHQSRIPVIAKTNMATNAVS